MKVGVIGLGYIGLPTALLHANAGHEVVGIDIDAKKVEKLRNGILPFQEKRLEELFEQAKKNFKATTDYSSLKDVDAIIVSVPTPMKDRKMMGDYVFNAMDMVGKNLKKGQLVILESTVTPGTTAGKVREILERESGLKAGEDFLLAYCPERAIPGNTIYEMVHNDRIIGGIDEESAKRAKELYSSFVKGNIYTTSSTVAEMVKVVENTYRDVNIALANELAKIAEKIGVNVYEVIELANKHPRVNVHQPGIGVGGHCLPIDPWFLVEVYPEAKLIPIAREINDRMVNDVVKIIEKSGVKRVTIFGEAYKPDVDDTRESPTHKLKELLERRGIEVRIYDPIVHPNISLDETIKNSQCIVISTAHSIFKDLNWDKIISSLEEPKLIVDGRHFFENPPSGALFYGIGRGDVN